MAVKATSRPEKDRSERWLLTYADLITLLMVFFVILYSFSIIDVKRFQDLRGSLDQAFSQNVMAGLNATSLSESVAYGNAQQRVLSSVETAKVSAASQLQRAINASGAGDAAPVVQAAQGVTIRLKADVLFQSGTAALKPAGVDLLVRLGDTLNSLPNQIQIIGNTDDLPPAATNSAFTSNWQMGQARAYSVLRVLVDRDKLPENRLSLWSKGQYDPVVPNTSAENRALNRRVDLLVVFQQLEDVPFVPFTLPLSGNSPQPPANPAVG